MPEDQEVLGLFAPEQGMFWSLDSNVKEIGRDPSCAIYSSLEGLSRKHARLTKGKEGWEISDLNSLNGVLVNGDRVLTRKLELGDMIACGAAKWVFCKKPCEPKSSILNHTSKASLSLTQSQVLEPQQMGLLKRMEKLGQWMKENEVEKHAETWLKCLGDLLDCQQVFLLRHDRGVIVEWSTGAEPDIWPRSLEEALALGQSMREQKVMSAPLIGMDSPPEQLVVIRANRSFVEDDHILLHTAAFQAMTWSLQQDPIVSDQGGRAVMVGESDALKELYRVIERAAPTDANVWIRGESGTGKELLAKELHLKSKRSSFPLISVNCGAIPASMAEAELFGQVKGAYTGALRDRPGYFVQADQGTLFLDEVLELSMDTQVKLLRVLQEGDLKPLGSEEVVKVDVRVICASHGDFKKLIEEGRFREDLYHRLHVIELQLPALREIREDILLLAEHFLSHYNVRYGRNLKLSSKALSTLKGHAWPGNIRELKNTMEMSVILARDERCIEVEELQLQESRQKPVGVDSLKAVGDEQILSVLEECGGKRAEAARRLGIARSTLYEGLKRIQS